MQYYLYRLVSHKTGLSYIGLTTAPETRLRNHLCTRRDIYGEGHTFELLAQAKNKTAASMTEAWLINFHQTIWPLGHNKRDGGLKGYVGRTMTEVIREKIRRNALGNKWCLGRAVSEETKAKMRASKVALYATGYSPLKGKKKSADHVAKMSANMKGKPAWNRGRKATEAERKANSESHKGLPVHNKGKAWTQEVKDRIAEAKMAKRAASGKPLSYAGVQAQKRKALARQASGLRPLSGTEHYLSAP